MCWRDLDPQCLWMKLLTICRMWGQGGDCQVKPRVKLTYAGCSRLNCLMVRMLQLRPN